MNPNQNNSFGENNDNNNQIPNPFNLGNLEQNNQQGQAVSPEYSQSQTNQTNSFPEETGNTANSQINPFAQNTMGNELNQGNVMPEQAMNRDPFAQPIEQPTMMNQTTEQNNDPFMQNQTMNQIDPFAQNQTMNQIDPFAQNQNGVPDPSMQNETMNQSDSFVPNQPETPDSLVTNQPMDSMPTQPMNQEVDANVFTATPQNQTIQETAVNQEPFSLNQQMDNQSNPFMQNKSMNQTDNINDISNPFPQAGAVPPVVDTLADEKPKKKSNKTAIFLIVVLLIAAVAFGIYYVLVLSKSKSSGVKSTVVAKELNIELGSSLPTDLESYADITGFTKDQCSFDTSGIDVEQTGRYVVEIKCGTITGEAVIAIKDTKAPIVIAKKVYVQPNTTNEIKLSSFISSCVDSTECSYQLDSSVLPLTTLVQTVGNHKITIIVTDEYDNETIVETELVVTQDPPSTILYCKKNVTDVDSINATLLLTYNYGINSSNTLNIIEKEYTFTFENIEDFNSVKTNYESTKKINNISGRTYFDETNLKIILFEDVTYEALNQELTNFPTAFDEIKNYHIKLGDSCGLKVP